LATQAKEKPLLLVEEEGHEAMGTGNRLFLAPENRDRYLFIFPWCISEGGAVCKMGMRIFVTGAPATLAAMSSRRWGRWAMFGNSHQFTEAETGVME